MADGHGYRRCAGRGPQGEPRGDGQHVENDDVLEKGRICHEQHEIAGGDLKEAPAQPERDAHRRDAEERGGRDGDRGTKRAGCNGPIGLERMTSILLSIEHVIDEIYRRRECAEDEEGDDRLHDGVCVVEALCEDEGREDEEVLRPLTGAQ